MLLTTLALFASIASAATTPACVPGSIKVSGRGPKVLAAPHGDFDEETGRIVEEACGTLQWACVVARGQRTKEHPVNVNRPTEGYGLKSDEERRTPCAEDVYAAWSKAVGAFTPRLYVEVHGNVRKELKSRLDVALVGLKEEDAQRLKKVLEGEREKHGLPWLEVRVEGLDEVKMKAGASKKWGELGKHAPALHFEFPRRARGPGADGAVSGGGAGGFQPRLEEFSPKGYPRNPLLSGPHFAWDFCPTRTTPNGLSPLVSDSL